jgi:hypothetical protein
MFRSIRFGVLGAIAFVLATVPALAQNNDKTAKVEVTNFPVQQAVFDVDNPAFQPFQQKRTFSYPVTPGSPTNVSFGTTFDPVPEGKRLVVEYVSFIMTASPDAEFRGCGAGVRTPGSSDRVSHPLPHETFMRLDTHRQFQGGVPIRFYAEAGEVLGIGCLVLTSANIIAQFNLTAHYIDVN